MARLHARAVADRARQEITFSEDPIEITALAAIRDAFDWFADLLDEEESIAEPPLVFVGEDLTPDSTWKDA